MFAFFIPRSAPAFAFSNSPAHASEDAGDQSGTDVPDSGDQSGADVPGAGDQSETDVPDAEKSETDTTDTDQSESDFSDAGQSESDFSDAGQSEPDIPDVLDRFQQAACQRTSEVHHFSSPRAATGEVWGISVPQEQHQENNDDYEQQGPTAAVVISQYRGKSQVPRIKRFLEKMVYIHRRHLAAHLSAQRETERQADLIPVLHTPDEAQALLSHRGLSVLFFHQAVSLNGSANSHTDAEVEVASNPSVQTDAHVHGDQGLCLSLHPGGGAVSAMVARKWGLMVKIATKYRNDPINFMWVDESVLPQLRQHVADKDEPRLSPLLLAFVRVTKNGLSTAACCDADLHGDDDSELMQEIVQEIDQALGGERFKLWKSYETQRLVHDLAE